MAAVTLKSNGNYVYAYTSDFKSCTPNINDLKEANMGEREKAAAIQKYAKSIKIRGKVRTTDNNGSVKFTDLPLGVYLIQNYPVTKKKEELKPFLVTVPRLLNNEYVYDVDASAKPEAPDVPGGNETEKPDNPDKPDNPGKPGNGVPGNKLPQTGQLWWPVPVLIAAGFLLIIFGLIRRRRHS